MSRAASNYPKRFIFAVGLLALTALVSGCKTTFRTVDERFEGHPENYQQVQILPVWFEGGGNVDHTLTTNDLQLGGKFAETPTNPTIRLLMPFSAAHIAGQHRGETLGDGSIQLSGFAPARSSLVG